MSIRIAFGGIVVVVAVMEVLDCVFVCLRIGI